MPLKTEQGIPTLHGTLFCDVNLKFLDQQTFVFTSHLGGVWFAVMCIPSRSPYQNVNIKNFGSFTYEID